jgi:uncharacterized NAD-dependent epimerase/dehydratase family protein
MGYMPYKMDGRRLMLLCEGSFDSHNAKTATGPLKWCRQDIVAVIDSQTAGRDPVDIVGFGHGVPIVATLDEAIALGGNQLVIGVANIGGVLPPKFRPVIVEALKRGCDVACGLHEILSDDPKLVELAKKHQATIYDLRLVPDVPCATNQARKLPNKRILAVGTDCNVGKMFATLALTEEFKRRGLDAVFAATGQTGILISGYGYAIDRAISDFAAGIAERLMLDTASHEYVFVEGQGSIDHPSYSGVTLSLLHGTAPQAMVLCHVHSRSGRRHDEGSPLMPLDELRDLYETMAKPILPAKVVGVSVVTRGLSEADARKELSGIEDKLGLPATDPVRFGIKNVADAVQTFFKK